MLKVLIGSTVSILIAAMALWYFSIKEYDYTISFTAPASTGEIHQKLLYYEYENLQDVERLNNEPFSFIVQKATLEDEPIKLTWSMEQEQEDLTRMSLSINNTKAPFLSRASLLFGSTRQQELLTAEVKRFKEALAGDLELYNIEVVGEAVSPASSCVCIPLQNDVANKAVDMMKNIHKLSNLIIYHDIKMSARPRIYVSSWDKINNTIVYDFCFPIEPATLPQENFRDFKIRRFAERKSILAVYYGNYMYSHLAWPKILQYAANKDLQVEETPLEIFYDNPELGGNSTNWKAEIYFPIK